MALSKVFNLDDTRQESKAEDQGEQVEIEELKRPILSKVVLIGPLGVSAYLRKMDGRFVGTFVAQTPQIPP
jgi:hypothetical protein